MFKAFAFRTSPIALFFASTCAFAADASVRNPLPVFAAGALFVATLCGLLVLGAGPNMLRDPLPPNATGTRPFSFGKSLISPRYAAFPRRPTC